MAKATKTTEVPAEVAEEIVNAQVTEVTEAKEESNGTTEENDQSGTSEKEVKTAKAGKRSAKGLAEAEEKVEKLEAQEHRAEEAAAEAEKPKQPVKPARSRLERRGKGYRKAAEAIEKGKVYSLKEALDLATKTSSGIDTITKELEKGAINFDILVATPANMAKLGKYARLLGPRGLMPNPKSGTVTNDVAKAVAEAKAGRVEFRVDSTGIVHLAIGKVSFGGAKLLENAAAVMASIRAAKPASVKGNYLKAVHVTTTMGPSITVSTTE
jgi:ribosomal protein L1